MMGIVIHDGADEPQAGSGIDQRQRALWALEGNKPVSAGNSLMLGFSKVELPDWQTPDVEQDDFQWTATNSSTGKANFLTYFRLNRPR